MEDATRFKMLGSIGYDSIRVIPSMGRFNGLTVSWKSSRISVTVLEENRQFFHLRCQLSESPIFILTEVYAIPYSNLRPVLWDNLQRLLKGILSSWCVVGDFNDILSTNK
ncbi:hypothetical protein K1719_032101 [Acacia pycnantha]|nr:hypothetical protein K1719_032101 [Acacia pycnantha]